MFQRQGFFTSGFDKIAPFTDYIGAEHILWSANFPLTTSPGRARATLSSAAYKASPARRAKGAVEKRREFVPALH
jgi:hypothetical protein